VAVLTSTRDRGDYGERVARSGARGFIPKGRAVHAVQNVVRAVRAGEHVPH
jgi:hypothetical protein